MATQLFFGNRDGAATTHLGTNLAKLNGTGSGWRTSRLHTARGSSLTATGSNTVDGPTDGIETGQEAGGPPQSFISPPLSADVTIEGTITFNLWAWESAMNANADVQCVVEVIRATDNSIETIVNSEQNTELGTSSAARNWTAAPTSTVVNRGDRLRARVAFNDQTTMGAGFTCDFDLDSPDPGVQGDSYITFTETFSFESAPAGTTLYFTDTASDVATASVDREAWTSRGGGVVDDVTNTAAGWTAPIHMTDTAGGTVTDWFTKQLQAFTLGGMAQANIRVKNNGNHASARVEIARVDSDGSNPSVWGSWCIDPGSPGGTGAIPTTETAKTCWVSGDDLAISDGQRLRIRLYVDDNAEVALAASQIVTFYYNGTSGGASGDSYVILPQTITESAPVEFVPRNSAINFQDPAIL